MDASLFPEIKRKNRKEKLILDFGYAWFVDKFIKDMNLNDSIGALGYGNTDMMGPPVNP